MQHIRGFVTDVFFSTASRYVKKGALSNYSPRPSREYKKNKLECLLLLFTTHLMPHISYVQYTPQSEMQIDVVCTKQPLYANGFSTTIKDTFNVLGGLHFWLNPPYVRCSVISHVYFKLQFQLQKTVAALNCYLALIQHTLEPSFAVAQNKSYNISWSSFILLRHQDLTGYVWRGLLHPHADVWCLTQ